MYGITDSRSKIGWKAVLTAAILVSSVYLTFRYRDQIAAKWPGVKTYVWNVIIGASGTVVAILQMLQVINWHDLMTPENAAIATLVIGVVGILLREVTSAAKSDEGEPE